MLVNHIAQKRDSKVAQRLIYRTKAEIISIKNIWVIKLRQQLNRAMKAAKKAAKIVTIKVAIRAAKKSTIKAMYQYS